MPSVTATTLSHQTQPIAPPTAAATADAPTFFGSSTRLALYFFNQLFSFSTMKSFYAILAFAALSLASCQKEALLAPAETIQAAAQNPETQHQTAQNPKGQTANAVQIWILEDTPYAASYGSNGLGQQTLELTSGPKTISAIGSAVNYLPGQIMDVFASLGVAVPVNSAVWQTSTGGFLVEIDQPGLTPTSVFWFNNWYGLRSIGRIQL